MPCPPAAFPAATWALVEAIDLVMASVPACRREAADRAVEAARTRPRKPSTTAYAHAYASRTFNELRAHRRTWERVCVGSTAVQVQHLIDLGRHLTEDDIPAMAFRDPD